MENFQFTVSGKACYRNDANSDHGKEDVEKLHNVRDYCDNKITIPQSQFLEVDGKTVRFLSKLSPTYRLIVVDESNFVGD